MKLHSNESQVVSESLFSILCQSLAFAHRLEDLIYQNYKIMLRSLISFSIASTLCQECLARKS